MRFKKPIVALSAAGLLALAACGGSSDDSSSGDTGNTIDKENLGNTGSGMDAEAKGPVTIDGAQKGGTVTVLTSLGLTTPIDPSDLYYTDTNSIMTSLVTRQLTQYKYDEASGQMILVPDIATDLGTPNDDYTEWKFTVRDGVKWETGDPVTAEDVAWGMCRSLDAKTFPNGPGLYYSNPYFLGGDTYKGPYTAKDPDCKQQKAISVDGNTITVKMSKPFPDFPYYASMPAMGPIPQGDASDPAEYARHPLSTGPYKIKTYSVAKSLILERNDQWDPATDPARTAYPDGYEFKAGQSPDQMDEILLADSGNGQTTLGYDDIQAKDYREFQNSHADRLVLGGQPCTYFYALDMRTIKDKAVREALAYAIPYEDQVISSGLIPDVNAVPASGLMPPGVPGRKEYNPIPDHKPFSTDPEKAKQLLADSGNEGYEIKFLFRTDLDTDVAGKDVLVKGLEKAGFTATPIPTTVANYSADRDNPDGPQNIRSYGWCSDWPSGATWIPPIFQSTDIAEVGLGTNEAAFNEPAIDQKINDVYAMDAADQPAAWQSLEEEIMTKYLPVIPRFYGGTVQAHGSKVHGDNIDNTLGMPTFRDIWLEQ